MTRPSFSDLFIDITLLIAQRSPCVKTQQAALLVKDSRIISFGYNGPPAHHLNCVSDGGEAACGKDVTGSCFMGIHAEQNAIGYAARNGINTDGCIVYCTMSPCISCAKLCVASGIKAYFYLKPYRLTEGLDFLLTSGVKTIELSERFKNKMNSNKC